MNKNISTFCKCGCTNGFVVQFKFESNEFFDVYISTTTAGFYARQYSFLGRLKCRIKAAWFMLCGKEFYLHEIVLNKEQWNEFVQAVNEVKCGS